MKRMIKQLKTRIQRIIITSTPVRALLKVAILRRIMLNAKARRAFAIFWMGKNVAFYAWVLRAQLLGYGQLLLQKLGTGIQFISSLMITSAHLI